MQKPAFKFAFVDKWGNVYVYCPICGLPHKSDGVELHIIQKCRNGGKKHCDWIVKHGEAIDLDPNRVKAHLKDGASHTFPQHITGQ